MLANSVCMSCIQQLCKLGRELSTAIASHIIAIDLHRMVFRRNFKFIAMHKWQTSTATVLYRAMRVKWHDFVDFITATANRLCVNRLCIHDDTLSVANANYPIQLFVVYKLIGIAWMSIKAFRAFHSIAANNKIKFTMVSAGSVSTLYDDKRFTKNFDGLVVHLPYPNHFYSLIQNLFREWHRFWCFCQWLRHLWQAFYHMHRHTTHTP